MKKHIILITSALLLTGCSTSFGQRLRLNDAVSVIQNFAITQSQVDTARNSYDGLVLAPMTKYAALPRCKLNQKITLEQPCHDRYLLRKLREVDKQVNIGFSNTQIRIDSGDNAGAVSAYKTLMDAVEVAKSLIRQTGV